MEYMHESFNSSTVRHHRIMLSSTRRQVSGASTSRLLTACPESSNSLGERGTTHTRRDIDGWLGACGLRPLDSRLGHYRHHMTHAPKNLNAPSSRLVVPFSW